MRKKRFGIPEDVLAAIRERDRNCVYCRKVMIDPYSTANRIDSATIEHLNFEGPFYWQDGLQAEDIVICCGACNSSRGVKRLEDWFASHYCVERRINEEMVADPVREYLIRNAKGGAAAKDIRG